LIQAAGGCRGERAGPRGGGGAPGPGVMQVAGRRISPACSWPCWRDGRYPAGRA